MTSRIAKALSGVALAALAASGCGIKGPLTLPEKTENVVIRAPAGSTVSTEVPAEGAATTASPEAPATLETTQKPATPKPDRLPPPPLPSSNPGTGHGG